MTPDNYDIGLNAAYNNTLDLIEKADFPNPSW